MVFNILNYIKTDVITFVSNQLNMNEVKTCAFSDQVLCDRIFEIRQKVFVLEQKVSREEEFDEFEKSSIHYLGYLGDIPAGTARWRITKEGIKLERFAVLIEFRNKGVAASVLEKVLNDTKNAGVKIYLHAQVSAVGFYEKYGFKKEGPLFVEADIEHYKMCYQP